MVIDFHNHFDPPEYLEAIRTRPSQIASLEKMLTSIKELKLSGADEAPILSGNARTLLSA